MQRRTRSSSSGRRYDNEDEASGRFNSRQQRRQQPLRRSTRLRFAACRVCRGRIEPEDLLECANTACGACAHRSCAVTGAWVERNDGDRVTGAGATGAWLCAVCGLEKYEYDADEEDNQQPAEGGPAGTDEAAAVGPEAGQKAALPKGLTVATDAAKAAEAAAAAATEARARATAAAEAAEAAESMAADSVHTATTLLSTLIRQGSSVVDAGAPGRSSSSANNNAAASVASTSADEDRAALKAEAARAAAAHATFLAAALGDVIKSTTLSGEATVAGGNKRRHDSAVFAHHTAGPAVKLARPACPICCQPVEICGATKPEACDHVFCFDCLTKWRRRSNSCPLDRIPFNAVMVSVWSGQPPVRIPMLPVSEQLELNDDIALDICAVCHIPGEESEDMRVCDHCEVAYHLACLGPREVLGSSTVLRGLEEYWYCKDCAKHVA